MLQKQIAYLYHSSRLFFYKKIEVEKKFLRRKQKILYQTLLA